MAWLGGHPTDRCYWRCVSETSQLQQRFHHLQRFRQQRHHWQFVVSLVLCQLMSSVRFACSCFEVGGSSLSDGRGFLEMNFQVPPYLLCCRDHNFDFGSLQIEKNKRLLLKFGERAREACVASLEYPLSHQYRRDQCFRLGSEDEMLQAQSDCSQLSQP